MATAKLLLNTWRGAPGNTMPQGVKHDPESGLFVFGQADDVKGQTEQDSIFRVHGKDLVYNGVTATAKEGGHLSSHGIFREGPQIRALLGHRKLGLGHVPVVNGSVNSRFVRLRGTMAGTATCSQKHDLLCMRQGDVYEGYTLSSVLRGVPKRLFRTQVPVWYKRFQGHDIMRINGEIVLAIHGDDRTKGPSEMRLLRITSSSKWRTLDEIDTTEMGDEAEGGLDYHDRFWVVKRTGNGSERFILLTPTTYRTWTEPPPAKPKPKPSAPKASDPKAAGTWEVYNVNSWLWGRLAENGRLVREDDWIKREPGFRITTGDHFTTIGGVLYLVTEAGRLYTAKYLRKIR